MAKDKPANQPQTASSPPPSQINFLSAFPKYIRIDISCASTLPPAPHELLHFLRATAMCAAQKVVCFLARLGDDPQFLYNSSAILWPGLFVFSEAEAKQSASVGQHRGCFLIGLESDGEADLRFRGDLFEDVFEYLVKKHRVWKDEPVEPKLEIRIVKPAELGRLVVDHAMWPQRESARALIIRADRWEATFRYYAPTEQQICASTKETAPQKTPLRPASDVLNRIKWDPDMPHKEYAVVYLDRFTGYQELPCAKWKPDSTDDEFIPLHRIVAFRDQRTGAIVWSRELRIDKIFNVNS
ncbi:hypothetical protein NA57DRAFT_79405 [Rhizodiscina lignyota]|uniref:MJ1316 RNA cyclic group end recognition domain-containing protein n=1 Tax=Rhizodiscina lignyota TaxID=1504668 RepID=A0A9P4IA59_9PEZI|nr:hypothetical protein NA57DRAFT_79405 [Rhizodiscina lignyota]